MLSTLILVTGGQRSGKSRFAEQLALSLSDQPLYMATSRIWDDEHLKRIQRHRRDRSDRWQTIEEDRYLSAHDVSGRVVLIDCVTLWSTNFFFDLQADVDAALAQIQSELKRLIQQNAAYLIFVTNEIGLGGTPENDLQRQFTDLLGWVNQFIAKQAHEVYLMVSGLPITIKKMN